MSEQREAQLLAIIADLARTIERLTAPKTQYLGGQGGSGAGHASIVRTGGSGGGGAGAAAEIPT